MRCGVIGLGRGAVLAKILARQSECELVAVCDPDQSRRCAPGGVRYYNDYTNMLANEDLEIVIVASPPSYHAEQAIACMEAGAHVLVETPCVVSVDEAHNVLRVARRTKRHSMLAENYIWLGWVEEVKRIIASGILGELIALDGEYLEDGRSLMTAQLPGSAVQPTWRANLPPLHYCTHTLGPILWLTGEVVNSAIGINASGFGLPGVAYHDYGTALLRTKRGTLIRLSSGFALGHPQELQYRIIGSRGAIWVSCSDGITNKRISIATSKASEWKQLPGDFFSRPDGLTSEEAMIQDFCRAIERGIDPPISLETSLDWTLPGIIAHESSLREGHALAVPSSNCLRDNDRDPK